MILDFSKVDIKDIAEPKPLYWFHFHQNNSGGNFIETDKIAVHMYVQATDTNEANQRAEDVFDLYFDGCNNDMDCLCCGDRWNRAWGSDCLTSDEVKIAVNEDINGDYRNSAALCLYNGEVVMFEVKQNDR